MKSVVIAGGSGTVGTRLSELLRKAGYKVLILTRSKEKVAKNDSYLFWDLHKGEIDERYRDIDYVVNLAGSGIAEGRWTDSRKEEIMNSRIDSSALLISKAKERGLNIKGYISASAIGYYGEGGTKELSEDSPVVTKEFLSDVCVAWEEAGLKAKSISPSVTILRIATVLSPRGGALEKMDVTIPYGVANYLGNGKQLMSWIHVDDLCRMIKYAIDKPLDGIFNATAPEVVSNKAFTAALRDVINPKALLLPAPALGIKLMFGEMSRVVLNSSNVTSHKIEKSGFSFTYPTVESALTQLYNSKKS